MSQHETATGAGEFDDIQMDDQPLPGWWKLAFLLGLACLSLYWMLHHLGAEGRSMAEAYDLAVAENAQLQFAAMGELKPDRSTLTRVTANKNFLKVGKVVFKTHCAACHGKLGEGKVGVNLTDAFYKNVSQIEDIASVVAKGAGGNAMPAWAAKLHPNEIVLGSAYVASLRGTNAPGGKAPEGRNIDPWPEPEPTAEADGQQPK